MEELKFTKTKLGKNATAIRFRCELYQSKRCPGRIFGGNVKAWEHAVEVGSESLVP